MVQVDSFPLNDLGWFHFVEAADQFKTTQQLLRLDDVDFATVDFIL